MMSVKVLALRGVGVGNLKLRDMSSSGGTSATSSPRCESS